MFIDTHLHLCKDLCKDVDKVILDAKEVNVNYLLLAGTSLEENIEQIEISKKHENVFLSLGYHPDQADIVSDKEIDILEMQIKENQVVAVGEIGLDYYYNKKNIDKQEWLFNEQLKLAEKFNLPVIIHTRDAIIEAYNIIKKYDVKGVIHCYSGNLEMAKSFIELGFYFGIGGIVTFKNSNLFEIVKEIPLDRILLETDSPFLSPLRGTKNEPKNIVIIAKKIAEIKEISIEEVGKITTSNTVSLFDLNI